LRVNGFRADDRDRPTEHAEKYSGRARQPHTHTHTHTHTQHHRAKKKKNV
jgi:hypothetical protein